MKHLSWSAGVLFFATIYGILVAAASEPDQTVVLENIQFEPSRIEVAEGDRVRFVNEDPFEHDVYIVRTANRNDVIVPATTLPGGESVTITIDQAGLFDLYCTIHGGMDGKITTTGSFELTEEQKKAAAERKVLPPEVKAGEKLFWDEAQCHQCHRVGDRGDAMRAPNLQDIGLRAGVRARKIGLDSATDYLVQSIERPSAHIVSGYSDDMPKTYQEPIGLEEEQLKPIVAYLQSQGGTVDLWTITFDAATLSETRPDNPFGGGDPDRGETVFRDSGCDSCHTIGSETSPSVGPELTEIGRYRSWEWFAESTLRPSAEIGKNWRFATVELGPFTEKAGALVEESPRAIYLMTAHDRVEEIPRDEIQSLEVSDESKMPANYDEMLTVRQMADLIAYLEGLRGGQGSATASSRERRSAE